LFSDQGKFEEAEEIHKRALAGYEKALGRDHKSTLHTVYNMAKLIKKCRVLQAEHMDMMVIDCIHCYVLIEEGPAHRLIVVLHPLSADQG